MYNIHETKAKQFRVFALVFFRRFSNGKQNRKSSHTVSIGKWQHPRITNEAEIGLAQKDAENTQ